MKRSTVFVTITVLAAAAVSARGAVLVGFDLASLTGINATVAPTSVDASVSGLNITEGAGVTATSGSKRLATHFSELSGVFTDAYTGGNYFQFGLTVQPGDAVSLSAIDEVLRRSSNAAPGNFLYVYSFDGFTSAAEQTAPLFSVNSSSPVLDLTTPTFTDSLNAGATAPNGELEPTANLSGIANLQNLLPGTTVTFRELAYSSTTTTNSLGIGSLESAPGGNDLAISGSALAVSSVPEPASIALAAVGGLACAARRRR